MTTYITITDPETDPDAPLTSELAKKWRDNALAMLEGDPTAPVNQGNWHPYNKVTNSDSFDGKFYDQAVDGTLATVVTPDFADGYEYLVVGRTVSTNNATTTDFQIEAYRETGAAYNPAHTFTGGPTAVRIDFRLYAPTVRQSVNIHPMVIGRTSQGAAIANSVVAWSDSSGAHQVVTAQKITRFRFSFAAGSIDGGQMFLYRRRLIV
jgi:hypothetical protein